MGPMNLVQSIAWSNDVYFYKLANALGPGPIIDAARALGVGTPTGIDLPGESPGYLGTPESVAARGGTWYGGSTVILGIGQGYLQTTPLQNARWTAGVATGQLVTPRLGLATGTDESAYTALPVPAPTPVPFADALGPVRDGMRAVVTGGTGAGLSGLPAPVGAKTGTAQDGEPADRQLRQLAVGGRADARPGRGHHRGRPGPRHRRQQREDRGVRRAAVLPRPPGRRARHRPGADAVGAARARDGSGQLQP